jgi:dCMP deaminase
LLNLPKGRGYEDCPAVHAEENAVVNAARNGTSVLGGTLYIAGVDKEGKLVEAMPCLRCRRILINAGIERVVIRKEDGGIKYINTQEWIKRRHKNLFRKVGENKKREGIILK